MADHDDGAALCLELGEPVQTTFLKREVAYCQHLVDQQHLGFDVDSYRKAQPYVHPRGVVAHRLVDKAVQFGEAHDVVKSPTDLPGSEAEDGPVQVDVLPASELWVEPGAQLE